VIREDKKDEIEGDYGGKGRVMSEI